MCGCVGVHTIQLALLLKSLRAAGVNASAVCVLEFGGGCCVCVFGYVGLWVWVRGCGFDSGNRALLVAKSYGCLDSCIRVT